MSFEAFDQPALNLRKEDTKNLLLTSDELKAIADNLRGTAGGAKTGAGATASGPITRRGGAWRKDARACKPTLPFKQRFIKQSFHLVTKSNDGSELLAPHAQTEVGTDAEGNTTFIKGLSGFPRKLVRKFTFNCPNCAYKRNTKTATKPVATAIVVRQAFELWQEQVNMQPTWMLGIRSPTEVLFGLPNHGFSVPAAIAVDRDDEDDDVECGTPSGQEAGAVDADKEVPGAARRQRTGPQLPYLGALLLNHSGTEQVANKVALLATGALLSSLLSRAFGRRRKGAQGGSTASQQAEALKKAGGRRPMVVDKPEDLHLIASACSMTTPPQERPGEVGAPMPEAWREEAAVALRQELRAAQQYTVQLEAKLSRTRHDRKKVNAEVLRAREAVAAAEQQLGAALEQIAVLQSRSMMLLGEKKAAEQGARELECELGSNQTATASKTRTLLQQVGALQEALQEAQAARAAAEAQLRAIRKQAAQQQHRQQQGSASVQRVRAEAEAAKADANEMRQALYALQEELEAQRTACAHSEAQLVAVQHELRRLQAGARSSPSSFASGSGRL